MRRIFYLVNVMLMLTMIGCTNGGQEKGAAGSRAPKPKDTIHTRQAAMAIYGYQPVQALQIIDKAVAVGNLSEWQADMCRARIYSATLMRTQLDSLLGQSAGARLDTALAIGERLLSHDSIKTHLKLRQDVLEVLANTERIKANMTGWLQRSQEYIEVCRQIGATAEIDALRTEAEIGAAYHAMGRHEEGMAKLDSVITQLEISFHREVGGGTFNGLDALIIAQKRKIAILGAHNQYAETLPLGRRILELLDDYEAHPDQYHDGSHREPKNDEKRADYIRFYRSQAQNYITAAYTALSEHNNMLETFRQIENSVHDGTAREHIARYNALQQQMEAEHQRSLANRSELIAVGIGILALLLLVFAVVVIFKNRTISRKNHLLAQQIAEHVTYKKKYWTEIREQAPVADPDEDSLNDEQLFQHIHDAILRERLFLDPSFGRQTIIERFQLSKERVGAIFSKGSEHSKMSGYIQQLRLEYAAKLLIEQPERSIVQIASDCGFSSHTYFSICFRQHFGMSPSDYRRDVSIRKSPPDDF